MHFEDLLTDTVTLLKRNGESHDGINANIQKNKILMLRADLLVDIGDFIQSHRSTGDEEIYEVIDPGFHGKYQDIPAGYLMQVRKLGLPEAEKVMQNIIQYKSCK